MEKINLPEENSLNSLEGLEEDVSYEGRQTMDQLRSEFPLIDKYLISSKKGYENNHVPIETGYYDNEKREFVIEMDVHPDLQAYEGVLHGGLEAYFVDIGGGMASLIEAQKLGKIVVTKKMKDVEYRSEINVGDKIRIVGRVKEIRKDGIDASAYIYKNVDGKELVFIRGSVEMKFK